MSTCAVVRECSARWCADQSESRVQSRDTSIAQRSGKMEKNVWCGSETRSFAQEFGAVRKKEMQQAIRVELHRTTCLREKNPTRHTLTRVRARTHAHTRARTHTHTRAHIARRKLTVPSLSRFKSSFSIDFSNRDAMSAFFSLLASRRSIFLLTPTSLRCVLSLSLRIRIRY